MPTASTSIGGYVSATKRGDERDEEQGREGAGGAAVDRHRAGDHGDLGDAPREEEDVVPAAVDDFLQREGTPEHAPGEVTGCECDEREPLGAIPSAHCVGGEHKRRQIRQPDAGARDAQAELDFGEIDDLEAQVAHGRSIGLALAADLAAVRKVQVFARFASRPPLANASIGHI